MSGIPDMLFRLVVPLLPTLAAIGLCALLERKWPASSARRGDRAQNLKVWAASLTGQFLLAPALGGFTTLAVNAVGGGLLELPSTGWWLVAGAAAYLVAMDFGEFLFHRAQHAIPWMWEMHSLHHSDPELDASTTVRHFWLDPLLKTVTIWLAVGLLFKASPTIVAIYMVFTFYHFFAHANVRVGFGKAAWLWNSPQYHRIHHGVSPEYYDVNFASLLPVFDVIFGSYRQPKQDEYPATGLDTGAVPASLTDIVTWPVRRGSGQAEADPARPT